jgi:hypothetical protein
LTVEELLAVKEALQAKRWAVRWSPLAERYTALLNQLDELVAVKLAAASAERDAPDGYA